MVDVLVRLEAVEDIRCLKARYFRLLDDKQWPEFSALFTADATMDISDVLPAGTPPEQLLIVGPAAIVASIGGLLQEAIMIHNGYANEIEVLSESEATGIWSMEDHVIFPEGVACPFPFRRSRAFGRYFERYIKQDGRWKIASLKLTRQYQEHG